MFPKKDDDKSKKYGKKKYFNDNDEKNEDQKEKLKTPPKGSKDDEADYDNHESDPDDEVEDKNGNGIPDKDEDEKDSSDKNTDDKDSEEGDDSEQDFVKNKDEDEQKTDEDDDGDEDPKADDDRAPADGDDKPHSMDGNFTKPGKGKGNTAEVIFNPTLKTVVEQIEQLPEFMQEDAVKLLAAGIASDIEAELRQLSEEHNIPYEDVVKVFAEKFEETDLIDFEYALNESKEYAVLCEEGGAGEVATDGLLQRYIADTPGQKLAKKLRDKKELSERVSIKVHGRVRSSNGARGEVVKHLPTDQYSVRWEDGKVTKHHKWNNNDIMPVGEKDILKEGNK